MRFALALHNAAQALPFGYFAQAALDPPHELEDSVSGCAWPTLVSLLDCGRACAAKPSRLRRRLWCLIHSRFDLKGPL